jgi:hypothetical protein
MDEDGQPDMAELPNADEILKKIESSGNNTRIQVETEQGTVVVKIPDNAIPKLNSGAPTPDEVEKIKQAILSDPTKPTGAYSIIFVDASGKRKVLDVFPVRDFPENEESVIDEPVLLPDDNSKDPQPNPQPKLQSLWLDSKRESDLASTDQNPSSKHVSSASSAFLLAAMWLSKESTSNHDAEPVDSQANPGVPTQNVYSRTERIKRRLSRSIT